MWILKTKGTSGRHREGLKNIFPVHVLEGEANLCIYLVFTNYKYFIIIPDTYNLYWRSGNYDAEKIHILKNMIQRMSSWLFTGIDILEI